jgi:hypothetical protein
MAIIINKDTTWAAGSTHVLKDTVQIAPGATLTIQAGAEIDGDGQSIVVAGNLVVKGSEDDRVTLKNVELDFLDNYLTPGSMSIQYADFYGSALSPPGSGYGGLEVRNSLFVGSTDYSYVWYPTATTVFENNLFIGHKFSVGTEDADVLFKNNTFVDYELAIEVWANGDQSPPSQTVAVHGHRYRCFIR